MPADSPSARRILITGASKGIGRAIAIRLARHAFDITVHYGTDQKGAEETLADIVKAGGSGQIIGFDVRDGDTARSKLHELVSEHGPYWGIVINAGITRDNAFPAIEEQDWQDVTRITLDGFYNVVHPLVMPMVRARKGGRIVAMASVSGVMGNRGQVNYSAAKAGLIGAVKALAVELASRKITVNAVAPGLIATGMTEDIRPEVMAAIPMKRMGTADEVSAAVDFLFSEEAGYITRQVIGVNGGLI
ncbi:MAG: 3-oxoacyl-ACP reductase FabG [Hyphomonadaceae bacterium]|nr:3-oxoacyl-ACP reductase FabG [Hyphomonadaceae bacterium]